MTPDSAPIAIPANQRKRIAIVDDHPMLREGFVALIESQSEFICAWTATSTQEALLMLEQDKPDLLTVDISLPGRNGLELIKDVLAVDPDMPILVISMHDETFYAQRVLKAGARGYIMKAADRTILLQAIRTVVDGGRFVSPTMSAQIMDAFSGKPNARPVDGVQKLSDREFEVFQLISEGKSTQNIAEILNISVKTAEVHRAHIREKLNLEDGAAVLRFAVRWAESLRLGAGH
jgi:DNA-binding NarL/FixJ family response regulator